ncbi:glycoside hydrolase family 3 N-terminal domain-containing protein [Bacillus salitolerans]|uniref:Glycoside hydrolase family 3 N-terminal domain-containing protein n=1 Tax=Bacillus salitolerans TaxID=1437434 RepID=A0ABW4LJX5_9BACI
MDLKKKIGQMMVIGFEGKTMPNSVKELIHEYHIGSIILFGRNIGTPEEVLALTSELQLEAKKAGYLYPLLICTDQENGVVRRLGEGATMFPGAMALGATGIPEYAYDIGYASALELKALGINWNLAPVLDVNNNPDNPVIGVRSFGELPEAVSEFGRASMKGMQAAGVVTTLKHFPGHGDTNIDSHYNLPTISHGIERLHEVELRPFRDAIRDGADTVMTAHIYFPTIEYEYGVPATLSKRIITGLLREELGFDGVVTTDCMEMNAISQTIGVERGSVEAIKAGVDLIMVSHRFNWQVRTMNEIIKSVHNGEIAEEHIDQALARIMKLKEKYVHWDDLSITHQHNQLEIVGCKEHADLAYKVYQQAVTLVTDNGILPLPRSQRHRIFVVYPKKNTTMAVEDQRYSSFNLGSVIREFNQSTDSYQFNNELEAWEIDEIVNKALQYDSVIVGTLTALPGSSQIHLINKMREKGCSLIIIAMRSPYDLANMPKIDAYLSTYDFSYPALKTAAGAIFGEGTIRGKLPVTIEAKISEL